MANTIGQRLYEAPPEAVGKVKEIIELRNMGSGAFYLAPYSESDLSSARTILRAHGLRPALRKSIETELNRRIMLDEGVKNIRAKNLRLENFEYMWEAVRSLFGKGPWDRRSRDAGKYLSLIKDEWGKK